MSRASGERDVAGARDEFGSLTARASSSALPLYRASFTNRPHLTSPLLGARTVHEKACRKQTYKTNQSLTARPALKPNLSEFPPPLMRCVPIIYRIGEKGKARKMLASIFSVSLTVLDTVPDLLGDDGGGG